MEYDLLREATAELGTQLGNPDFSPDTQAQSIEIIRTLGIEVAEPAEVTAAYGRDTESLRRHLFDYATIGLLWMDLGPHDMSLTDEGTRRQIASKIGVSLNSAHIAFRNASQNEISWNANREQRTVIGQQQRQISRETIIAPSKGAILYLDEVTQVIGRTPLSLLRTKWRALKAMS